MFFLGKGALTLWFNSFKTSLVLFSCEFELLFESLDDGFSPDIVSEKGVIGRGNSLQFCLNRSSTQQIWNFLVSFKGVNERGYISLYS